MGAQDRTSLAMKLLFDPRGVDSSILRALLGARNQAEKQESGFAVALDGTKAPAVQRILEVTGLLEVFPVLAGRERAVEVARRAAAG